MSALTLNLKKRPDQRVDMSPLACQHLLDKSPVEIGEIPLQCGKQILRVDELFAISGENTQDLVMAGSCAKLDNIGKNLNGGTIRVEGDAGAYLGFGMRQGTIRISGNAGIYAGGEMKKGLLEISGDCGDFLGAALPGNKQGMKGGTILVKGNAGDRVGDHMRRGIILIEGNVGDYCGSRMIAGTIAVLGQSGQYLGYAMRRGTLLMWQKPNLPATFNDCGPHTLSFLPMLFKSFSKLESRFADSAIAFNRVQRYGGDLAEAGKGEVLVRI